MKPVEVWLTKKNLAVRCMVVHEDESTARLNVNSLSMRGAQREATTHFQSVGYCPVGRWKIEAHGETSRQFRGQQ